MTRKTSASTHAAVLTPKRAEFSVALLGWYRVNARRLPWRESPSLYRTVVSEFMLQQTQVKTVLPYFARWHDALPDFAALAAAPEDQVLKLWEGLGYYSRARNLHRLAQAIAALPAAPRPAQLLCTLFLPRASHQTPKSTDAARYRRKWLNTVYRHL
jgi:A/G-specific adenine glycosylase